MAGKNLSSLLKSKSFSLRKVIPMNPNVALLAVRPDGLSVWVVVPVQAADPARCSQPFARSADRIPRYPSSLAATSPFIAGIVTTKTKLKRENRNKARRSAGLIFLW
jgi:hypothetical protein